MSRISRILNTETLDTLYSNFDAICNERVLGMDSRDKGFKRQERRESIAYNKFMRECDRLGLNHIEEASNRRTSTIKL